MTFRASPNGFGRSPGRMSRAGFTLGPELVVNWINGDTFTFDTFTPAGSGFAGAATTAHIAGAYNSTTTSVVVGESYAVSVTLNSVVSSTYRLLFVNGTSGAGSSRSSTVTLPITAGTLVVNGITNVSVTDAAARIQISNGGSNISSADIASVSVRRIS